MSSLRRLAKDHATLRASTPPNYLFPPSDDSESLPDDLTQLSIHLTGSEGTPYSSGLWLLHLRIPHDYPKSPPKAAFKTRIFHPNVEESSGAVCLETLKRDWDPKLTLKDILITISCLLIQPNPDSALNEKAGVLVREDYNGFVRQARLMTKIHAPIPSSLVEAVEGARRRGEENESRREEREQRSKSSISAPRSKDEANAPVPVVTNGDESTDSAKENDPSQGLAAARNVISPTKNPILGKRPLTEVSVLLETEEKTTLLMSQTPQIPEGERPRKSPKHTYHSQANGSDIAPTSSETALDGKANTVNPSHTLSITFTTIPQASSRKGSAPAKYRTYARIGIKRL